MKIFLGTVLGTLLCCSLAHGQRGVASDGHSAVDGGSPAKIAAQPSGARRIAERRSVEDKIAWGNETNGLVAQVPDMSARPTYPA